MPHDFSKCTSNVCLSANLGFNNGKSPEKRIFAAGACLPKQSPYHWVEIRGRFVDGEWSSRFPKHFGKLTLGLCLQGCLKVHRRKGRGVVQQSARSHHPSPDQIRGRSKREPTQGKQEKSLFSWISPLDLVDDATTSVPLQAQRRR